MSKKILFFGNERLATGVTTTAPALRGLIAAGYEIAAIIVAQNDMAKSRKARPLEVAEIAKKHDIPLIAPVDLLAVKDTLAAYGAQAAVLVAYGKIVPPAVLEIFPSGIINIHPSLLPLYRGSTPIESAILESNYETGVSLMKLSAKMDAGPVYDQSPFYMAGMTKQQSADALAERGTALLLKHLPKILGKTPAAARPQDKSSATYTKLITKQDGLIDWQKSAERLEREIRAYAGWPRSRTTISGKDVIITKARVSDRVGPPGTFKNESGRLLAFCKRGALEIESLVPAGKKEMRAKDFLAGHSSL
ncbi:MAG TPA: methionyl-tRNA formyltransferase [Candidatus Saccharimonadales bacterium]|nr:methionyl-tRNA formyltransferase [Candidatus Saccharimonadales bacterium]